MNWLLLVSVGLSCGCASYVRSKIELTEQVRHGLESTRSATAARATVMDQWSQAQLDRLDEAFDKDVNDRPVLTAEWVIAHRRAYIALRDVLCEKRASYRDGQATIENNLAAIDTALTELQRMHAIESKLTLPELK